MTPELSPSDVALTVADPKEKLSTVVLLIPTPQNLTHRLRARVRKTRMASSSSSPSGAPPAPPPRSPCCSRTPAPPWDSPTSARRAPKFCLTCVLARRGGVGALDVAPFGDNNDETWQWLLYVCVYLNKRIQVTYFHSVSCVLFLATGRPPITCIHIIGFVFIDPLVFQMHKDQTNKLYGISSQS